MKGLKEDKDLDGAPADSKEEDDHNYHFGHFAPDTYGSFRQEVDLRAIKKRECWLKAVMLSFEY